MPSATPSPSQWNEAEIMLELRQLRDQRPNVIPYFIESIKQRLIIGQDDHTALARLEFLRTRFELLKLTKDFQQSFIDLQLLSYDRTKRIKTLELETEKIDIDKRSQSEVADLELAKKRKQLKLEIARIDDEMKKLRNSPKPEPKLTAEEQKIKGRQACEANLQRLNEEKKKALKIENEEERNRKLNAIDDAIQHETERWSGFL